MSSLIGSLATIVTFAPSLAASIATHLPIPLEPPVIYKNVFQIKNTAVKRNVLESRFHYQDVFAIDATWRSEKLASQ